MCDIPNSCGVLEDIMFYAVVEISTYGNSPPPSAQAHAWEEGEEEMILNGDYDKPTWVTIVGVRENREEALALAQARVEEICCAKEDTAE